MPVDPRVKPLVPMHDHFTPEREMLAHARRQADELGLDDYFVVDVDSHRDPALRLAGDPAPHGEPRDAVQLAARPRRHGRHAIRADAGRPGVPVPGHARPDPAPGADPRGPRADRRPARRRALPARDRRDEHRRPGRVPDVPAVVGDVADADRRVAGRLRLQPLDGRGVLQPGAAAEVPAVPAAQRPRDVPADDPRVRGQPERVRVPRDEHPARPRARQPLHAACTRRSRRPGCRSPSTPDRRGTTRG